jgi:hypothetical protein
MNTNCFASLTRTELLILHLILIGAVLFSDVRAADGDVQTKIAKPSHPVVATISGPWGELEYFETAFIAPQSLIDRFVRPTTETIWRFPGWTRQELMDALQKIPFRKGQLDWVDEPDGLFELKQEVRLYPTDEMISGMSQQQRLALHRLLSRWPENQSHRQPKVVMEPIETRQWFRAAGLPAEIADEIAALTFKNKEITLFTEVEFIMKKLDDEALQDRFVRALTRTPGLIVRLKVTSDANLQSIENYWRGQGKHKAISPILDSIAMTKGVDYLDVAHLLPPMPRMLLNTFPDPTLMRANKSPDCTWTAVHFFRSEPSSRMLDMGSAAQEIEAMYEPVTDAARFGDLLSFVQVEDSQPIHVAVHIAGDIAFTKNGNGLFVPWVFMRTPDILRLYSKDQPVRIETLRIKTPVPG